jgi:predicted phosphoribosyltransferase
MEAGKLLSEKLKRYRGKDCVVYALPRGGVVLGAEIARFLDAPLDLVISRKVAHPFDPEYAVCAVTETGPLICNPAEKPSLDKLWLRGAEAEQRAEARRRREVYLGGQKPISAKGKTAILVDDGVATGLTMSAAVQDIKTEKPKKIVVAVPVLPGDTAAELAEDADIEALEVTDNYLGAVAAYYDDFPQLEDIEVIALMEVAK